MVVNAVKSKTKP